MKLNQVTEVLVAEKEKVPLAIAVSVLSPD